MGGKTGRTRAAELLLFFAVFAAMLLFFTVLHPIPIMDEDDVIYTVLSRKAIPIPGAWNPSRMMPEILSCVCGNLAGVFAALGFGSFIDCQVFVLGMMLSAFIAVYAAVLYRLLETRLEISRFAAAGLAVLFLLLHFLIFRTDYSGNRHMFHTYDACCVFFYTIPAVLSCTLVMHFMTEPERTPSFPAKQPLRESLFLLTLYFAVFSNLFGSVTLAVYALLRVLRDFIAGRKDGKRDFRAFLRQDAFWIVLVLLWLLALILEATGGRAGGGPAAIVSGETPYGEKLGTAAGLMLSAFAGSSLLFRLLLAAALLAALASLRIRPDRGINRRFLHTAGVCLLWGIPSAVFLLFLGAAVNPLYLNRPEVLFPVAAMLFLLTVTAIAHLIRRLPKLQLLLPILLVFVFSMINTRFLTFCDSNPLELNGHTAVAVENRIYGSIIEAAEAGETEITIPVPVSGEDGNWPHDGNIGRPIAQFFLKYGLIDHEIMVHVEPSEAFNREFLIPIP